MKCTLCESRKLTEFFHINEKTYGQYISKVYYRCSDCFLIFIDPIMHLKAYKEKSRYETHENNNNDINYQQFLLQAWLPLKTIFDKAQNNEFVGLDFGCGPNPVLAGLISKDYNCKYYDPYFYNDKNLLDNKFDFVISTEVFEHFNKPKESIEKVVSLLKNQSYLSVMTSFYTENIDFKNWKYRKDQTHVCFYSEITFEWIAKKYNLEITKMFNPVVIFRNQ